jgi:aminoglycoside/choline kinase family phosphotransferase/dTDP-glucose pyrophosphorylase
MKQTACKTAMILAAGLGTRLRPYTAHMPKALFSINGEPLLAIAIRRLAESGFGKVLINSHHHHRRIEAFVNGASFSVPVVLRYEPDILGTGGGIRNLADHWLPGPLLVINADIVTDIDLGAAYRFHCRHGQAVTMVMHDHEAFNTVCVEDERVLGFGGGGTDGRPGRRMAFTGIHLLGRRVLDFLPESGPAHIIEAYEKMIAAGEQVLAYTVKNHYWQDIGTPSRYRQASYAAMAPKAFESAFGFLPDKPVERARLHGDGSDRRWYRLSSGGHTLIMADHHIRSGPERQEVDAYVDIGRHLHARGAAVPRIVLHDNCSGLVFLEDLGDRHLQNAVARLKSEKIRSLYERVIDRWLEMAIRGAQDFDTGWTNQTPRYDRHVVLEFECRYFMEAFVNGHLGREMPLASLSDEFKRLADRIERITTTGFMHRDLQSRNIMIRTGEIRFIDFQGGRLGPLQYDLASLLIDPYTALPPALQRDLLDYCAGVAERRYGIDRAGFTAGYACCALARNLQVLGAFAFLGGTRGKTQFFDYIPAALGQLNRTLDGFDDPALPKLKRLAEAVAQAYPARTPDPNPKP